MIWISVIFCFSVSSSFLSFHYNYIIVFSLSLYINLNVPHIHTINHPPTPRIIWRPMCTIDMAKNYYKECVQLDTKLICGKCKLFRCECSGVAMADPVTSLPSNNDQRNCTSRNALDISSPKPGGCDNKIDFDRTNTVSLSSILASRSSMDHVQMPVQNSTTQQHAATNWFLDKIQMTTNRIMAKVWIMSLVRWTHRVNASENEQLTVSNWRILLENVANCLSIITSDCCSTVLRMHVSSHTNICSAHTCINPSFEFSLP